MTTETRRSTVIVAVLACSALAFAAAQTMVTPALPTIGKDLGASTTTVSWVLTGFLVSAAIAPPICGRLGDLYGKHRLLAATLAVFAAGSLLCALVHQIGPLIAGRVVMGAGGAIFPLAFGIVRDELPAERVPGAIGVIAATFGLGGAGGTVLSGVVVEAFGYRALFWIVLAVALVALTVVLRAVPPSPVRSTGRVDILGALLLAAWIVALLVAISEARRWGWTSPATIGLLAASVAGAVLWTISQTRRTDPLIDFDLLRHRTLLAVNANSLLIGFALFATFLTVPLLVQAPVGTGYGFAASVTAAGIFLMPAALGMLVGGPAAGRLARARHPRTPLVLGAALIAVGIGLLAVEHTHRGWIYAAMAIFGIGIGLAVAAQGSLTVAAVHPTQTGAAGGANTVVRTVGGALGAQIAAALLAAHTIAGTPYATGAVLTTTFALITAAAAGAALLALAVPHGVEPPGDSNDLPLEARGSRPRRSRHATR